MFEIGGSRYEMSVVFDAMKADKMIANKSAAGYATRPMPNERLDRIRDVFCFCALTGLAFTDVDHLRREHFTTDEEGPLWIHKPREKTAVMSRVPVLPQAAALLEKYRDDANCRARGKLLPVPSNTKMNAYLKEIADICLIQTVLTLYTARLVGYSYFLKAENLKNCQLTGSRNRNQPVCHYEIYCFFITSRTQFWMAFRFAPFSNLPSCHFRSG